MRSYMFIDGASFEKSVEDLTKQDFPDTSVWDMISLNAYANQHARVFYYDSLPIKKDNQSEQEFEKQLSEKQKYFDRINETTNCHVHSGVLKHRKGKKAEQKGVDVMLAIQVMENAYRGNMDQATIFTSDLDFFPVLDALTQTRVSSNLIYDRKKATKALIHSADSSEEICYRVLPYILKMKYQAHFMISGANQISLAPTYEVLSGMSSKTHGRCMFARIKDGTGYILSIGISQHFYQCMSIQALEEFFKTNFDHGDVEYELDAEKK